MCGKKAWRKKYPIKAAYQTLKYNAKRRGKTFTITFEYFKAFCFVTNYHKKRGKRKDCYSVDRINPELGYIEGNIRSITVSDNVRRVHYAIWDDNEKQMKYWHELITKEMDNQRLASVPF